MKATQELKNEHEGIEIMLRILEAVSGKLARDEQIPVDHLDGILEFLSVFVDKCHHGKEEEFLFPALEAAGIQRDGGPIGVMLHEHEQGRTLVSGFKAAAADYATGNKAASIGMRKHVDEYAALMTRHIAKENTVLFPMGDKMLETGKDVELFEAFEQLERERIGVGKHEAFHRLLDRLQNVYLHG